MTDADPRYGELAAVGPYAAAIGGSLITMVEPHPGHEVAYTRWFEDDHRITGAMEMPWMFAGSRWVAPRAYRQVRYPLTSAIAQPFTAGRYISLYWVTLGRINDHLAWTTATNRRLRADGRGFEERTHVFTSFHDYLGVTYRDAEGPRDIHALDHRYPALVVEIVDGWGPGDDIGELDHWLVTEYGPKVQSSGAAVAQTLRFRPRPLPRTFDDVRDNPGIDTRITVLHFLEEDPLASWETTFARHGEMVKASGLGTLQLCAPFIPVVMGTNRYVFDDQ